MCGQVVLPPEQPTAAEHEHLFIPPTSEEDWRQGHGQDDRRGPSLTRYVVAGTAAFGMLPALGGNHLPALSSACLPGTRYASQALEEQSRAIEARAVSQHVHRLI